MRRGRWLRRLGLACVAAGVAAIAVPGLLLWSAMRQEQQLTQTWREVPRVMAPGGSGAPAPASGTAPAGAGAAAADQIAFAIRVPKLGYYAAVRQGVTEGVLFAGPGHYPTTAWPGRQGNVGVAAHNTYWLQFGRLRPGDQVVLEAREGTYTYRVVATRVVGAGDRTVLGPTADHRLTLTTCWPLWAGALAPDRLAIVAEQVAATAA